MNFSPPILIKLLLLPFLALLGLTIIIFIRPILPVQKPPADFVPSGDSYRCLNCNVILISVDTLRADHLEIYGYKRVTSPNIDRFFKDGLIFLNHISQSANTLPSHMSLFTSLYPQEHGVRLLTDPPLKKSYKTIAEILKENGYATLGLYTGSDHLDPQFGFERGFDSYLPGSTNEDFVLKELSELQRKNKKFFLFLHPYNPHDPYIVPKKYSQKFTDPDYQGKIDSSLRNYPEDAILDLKKLTNEFWAKVDSQSPEDIKHLQDLYDAEIFLTDEKLRQLFSQLEEDNQLDKTIVILTSDHGEEFFEHGQKKHQQLYDEVIKIPLLIRYPKNPQLKTAAITQNIDIAPTILDLLDLPDGVGFSGKSLLPLIVGATDKVNDYTISQWSYSTAIRTLEWKLLLYQGKDKEFYNLKTDPGEKVNVIKKYPEIAEALKRELNRVFKKVDFEPPVLPPQNLDKETRERLFKEGYF